MHSFFARPFSALLVAGAVAGGIGVVGGGAVAQAAPKVLACGTESFGGTAAMASALMGTGLFASVDSMDCGSKTPTAAQLLMYDAVLVWSGEDAFEDPLFFANSDTLGDRLADYIDAGGGVVVANDTFYDDDPVGGRFEFDDYGCLQASFNFPDFASLDAAPNDASSPLVKGVTSLTSQQAGSGTLASGATSVWDMTFEFGGSAPGVATCSPNGKKRVDLNFEPNPDDYTGDGLALTSNALLYVSGGFNPLKGSPSPAKAPDVCLGATSDPFAITFTNTGMSAQSITGFSLSGAQSAEYAISAMPSLPLNLPPSQSFTVSLQFSPAAMGMRKASLAVAVVGQSQPASVDISGNGIPAHLTVTPTPIAFGGTHVGTPVTTQVTIANVSPNRVTIEDLGVDDTTAFSLVDSPDLPVAIGAGASFTVQLQFLPLVDGTTTARLVLTSDDPACRSLAVSMNGYSGPPAIALDQASVSFGKANVGAQSFTELITVSNTGYSDLAVTDLTLGGANPGDFLVDKMTLPGSIGAQGTATFSVTFAPTAVGARTATLTIASNDPKTPSTVLSLNGTGTTATVMVAPATLDLGSAMVGMTGAPSNLTISTTGTGTLKVLSIDITGADAFAFAQTVGSVPPFNINANGDIQIGFSCSPAAIGPISATATVTTDVGPASAMLTCNGTAPRIVLQPNLIDFDEVPVNASSAPVALTITNQGTDDLSVSGFIIQGANQGAFNSNDLPADGTVIAAGASLSMHFTFAPTQAGMAQAEVDFTTNDTLLSSARVMMVGRGAQGGMSVTPTLLDFGTVLVGQVSAARMVLIQNTGEVPLNVTRVQPTGAKAAQFSVDDSGPFTLPPGQSVTVSVTFVPATNAGVQGTLSVQAAALPPQTVVMKGIGFAPTLVAALPGGVRTLDFGMVKIGTLSDPLPVALKNNTVAAVTIASIVSSNPAFRIDQSMTTATVQPSTYTTFNVAFDPTVSGSAQTTITVKLKDATSTTMVAATGVGVAAASGSGCSVGGLGAAHDGVGGGVGGVGLMAALLIFSSLLWSRARRRRPARSLLVVLGLVGTTAFAGAAQASALDPSVTSLTYALLGTGSVSDPQMVVYTNDGNGQIKVTSVVIGGINPGDFAVAQAPMLPTTLGPGASFTVGVTFSPTASGTRLATLSAQVAGETGTSDVSLLGMGVGPIVSVTPSPIVIGGLPAGEAPPPVEVNIFNDGGSMLHVSAVTLGGPDASLFTLSGVPSPAPPLGPKDGFLVRITFSPSTVGKAKATLTVASDDPATPKLTVAITGLSGDPELGLDVGTAIFGAERVGQIAPKQPVNISNTGSSDLHVSAVTITGPNASDFVLSGVPPLPATVPVGSTLSYAVTFAPLEAGPLSAWVEIDSDDPKRPMRKQQLSGIGTVPSTSITPSSIDFGAVKVSAGASSSVSFVNDGTGLVTVTALSLSGPGASRFKLGMTAPFSVAAMSSAAVTVDFAPTSVATSTATINVTTDDPALPTFTVPLTGSGTTPVFTLSPGVIDFGNVLVDEVSPAKSFRIGNSGNQDLNVTSLTLTGSAASAFTLLETPILPFTVAAGASVTFDLDYAPFQSQSIDSAEVDITVDDPNSPMGSVSLTGTGVQPVLSVSPAMDPKTLAYPALDFDDAHSPPSPTHVNESSTRHVTLENTGGWPLSVSAISVNGTNAAAVTVDPQAPLMLPAGGSLDITLTFTPLAAGDVDAYLEIDSDDVEMGMVSIPVTGHGSWSLLSMSPTLVDFGLVAVGNVSTVQQVTIHNARTDKVTLDRLVPSDPRFIADNSGWQPTLAGDSAPGVFPVKHGDSTTFLVSFAPDAVGEVNGSIALYLPGRTNPEAVLTVRGQGVKARVPSGCSVGPLGDRSGGSAGPSLLALLSPILLAAFGLSRRRRTASER